jgi:hypothetical protein
MMLGLVELLFAYGLTFGMMHKLPSFVYSAAPAFLSRLLSCAYCTGFHAGWMAYLVSYWGWGMFHLPSLVIWAIASAAFSYGADTLFRWAESRTLGGA